MIVKRVTIDGFKNLKNVALDLSDFTYLISCNNYGKSNVFQALDYVSEILDFIFSSILIFFNLIINRFYNNCIFCINYYKSLLITSISKNKI